MTDYITFAAKFGTMNISFNWLKEYLDFEASPEEVSALLTDTGLEVETLSEIETVKGGLKGLVIGHIDSIKQHPNADRLQVAMVDVGDGEAKQIVCGAPNAAVNQSVVVALPGTTLFPTEGESFKIKKGKLRGEVSEGMICAEDEIGLGTGHDGIMVLDGQPKPGTPASDYFNISSDWLIEIGLTPNRTDAMSHFGVARDLKAVMDVKGIRCGELKTPEVAPLNPTQGDVPKLTVKEPAACPRYVGISIKNVTVSDSPEWLQNRLRSIGLAPINNVVDATNYVLHGYGQPLHAFDEAKIYGNHVIVQTLNDKTPFVTLDETERKLSSNDLMICDEKGGMCIAGVFGGANSGITKETTNVFLESAYFDPVYVRKTAKRHGLQTDASFRYERGIDPTTTRTIGIYAAQLIAEITGGTVVGPIQEFYPKEITAHEVEFHPSRAQTFIGKDIPFEEMKTILNALEIEVKASDDTWNLRVPAYRTDVRREADVIEEVLRIYGYNNVEIPEQVSISIPQRISPDRESLQEQISDALAARGYHEAMANSLTKASHYDNEQVVSLLNPLSQDLGVLRQSLLEPSLECAQYNLNRQQLNIKAFEFGTVYHSGEKAFKESSKLAIWITGKKHSEGWSQSNDTSQIHHLITEAFAVCRILGIRASDIRTQEYSHNTLSYGIELLAKGRSLGYVGSVSNETLSKFDIDQPIFYSELNWDNLLFAYTTSKDTYQALPKYPKVRRDLALVVDSSCKYGDLARTAQKAAGKLLVGTNLFDIYEGKGLEEGKKSYAMSFTFLDHNKTLTDTAVDAMMKKLYQALQKQHGAVLRSGEL